MTKEQKLEWVAKCTNEELVEQLRWTVLRGQSNSIAERIDANEDYELVKAELMKRLG